jgi:hypothetical protein
MFRFGRVYSDEPNRFGLSTNAYLNGVAINDVFDGCAAGIQRCCRRARSSAKAPTDQP